MYQVTEQDRALNRLESEIMSVENTKSLLDVLYEYMYETSCELDKDQLIDNIGAISSLLKYQSDSMMKSFERVKAYLKTEE